MEKRQKNPTFTKASTPEGIRKKRTAIKDYYIKEMKKYYVELFGETNEDIFPQNSE